MCSLVLHFELPITALLVVYFVLSRQSVPKYNVRSTVILKHRSNWDNVRCAVSGFTWSTILKSADPLDTFDRAIGEVISRLVATIVCRSRSGDKQRFDASCRRLMMLSKLRIVPGVESAVQIIAVNLCSPVLRIRGSMLLQGSQSHDEQTRDTRKHSTCSHKWWETLIG